MSFVCFYFQLHHPFRLRRYTVFDIGQDHHYEDADMNCDILLRTAQKCYLPMNDLLLQLIRRHKKKFKVSFSLSGTCLDQLELYAPEVIDGFRALADTGCVEFLSETFAHSLSFLYSPAEFTAQIRLHDERIAHLFGKKPKVFRNTELVYNNDLAAFVENMGYRAVLAEGADHVLGWRNPNFVYRPAPCSRLKLLLRNYSLSDDVAFRFSDKNWSEYPLTAQKFAGWLGRAGAAGKVINLFMDYETFGGRHEEDSGIFDFMRALPGYVLAEPGLAFATLSEAAEKLEPAAGLDVPQFMSWADAENDLASWLGNDMQHDALAALYRLEGPVHEKADPDLLSVWRKLQSSDHFYYMSTKWFADNDVHKYFNPYGNPYDAYINFMNVLGDFELSLRGDDAPPPRPGKDAGKDRKTEKREKAPAAKAAAAKKTADGAQGAVPKKRTSGAGGKKTSAPPVKETKKRSLPQA